MIGGYSEEQAPAMREKARQDAEHFERMQQQTPSMVPPRPGYGVPTSDAMPINQRIRELTADLADAADFLTDRRRESQEANAQLAEAEALREQVARVEAQSKTLREVGDWMAECIEDSLVNLAEWEHSPKEDALEAWRELTGGQAGER